PVHELQLERAKALTGAGVLSSRQGDSQASEAYNRAALEIRRRKGDRLGEARSLYNLASLAGSAGDIDRAEEYLTAAMEIFREQDDQWSLAYALFNLSALAGRRGRPREASAYLEERLRLQSSLGDEAGMAETHSGLGHLRMEAGDLNAAYESFEAALDIAMRLNLGLAEVAAREGLALVAHERGLHKRSKDLFVQSSRIRTEHELAPTLNSRRLSGIHQPTSTAT